MKPYSFVLFIFSALLLIACSPKIQPSKEAFRPATLQEAQFQAPDGVDLPLKTWKSLDPEKAIVIAVHGFNDYRNGFAFPASWWMQRGITTIAYDQRSFGESENVGVWPGTEQLLNDLSQIVSLVRQKNPDSPIYLLGESMGGAVVMTAVTQPGFPAVDGIILSAPAVWGWKSLNPFYRTSLWAAAHLFPSWTASGSGLGIQASDNISVLRNLGRDPLFIKETRIDAVYGLVGLMDRAYDSAENLKLPLLVLYGANDEIIPKSPVEDVVARLPKSADVVLYEDGWHLLMRDLQAEVVWNDIESWIKTRSIPSGNEVNQLPLFASRD
ncbi:alpha/beta hydrolase [Sneathiella limimaris]|uniref:alpha/beta hydrolase n=1 Tax=Sneathiella limimaris TaxID=1964213 RepID=UPI00146A00BA|nr:alpha/beta hydrolase [Sneathiella limimaris]